MIRRATTRTNSGVRAGSRVAFSDFAEGAEATPAPTPSAPSASAPSASAPGTFRRFADPRGSTGRRRRRRGDAGEVRGMVSAARKRDAVSSSETRWTRARNTRTSRHLELRGGDEENRVEGIRVRDGGRAVRRRSDGAAPSRAVSARAAIPDPRATPPPPPRDNVPPRGGTARRDGRGAARARRPPPTGGRLDRRLSRRRSGSSVRRRVSALIRTRDSRTRLPPRRG